MIDLNTILNGDVVKLDSRWNREYVRGSVFRLEYIDSNSVHLRRLLSDGGPGDFVIPVQTLVRHFTLCKQETDYEVLLSYGFKEDSNGYTIVYRVKEEIPKPTIDLTYDELSKIFKYIPIRFKGQYGFYYNGNIIVNLITKEAGAKFSHKKGKTILIEAKHQLSFIPIKPEEVIYYYSNEALLAQCKVKIKTYEKSGKFFAYTNEKKELINHTVDILEIKLKDTIKKSTEPQNTISVAGKTRKLRFVMDELEIVYPNVNGWSIPKDRTLKEGSTAILKDNRSLRHINKNEVIVISKIRDIGNKKYATFKHNNKVLITNLKNLKVK